jgi:hypothetical protein
MAMANGDCGGSGMPMSQLRAVERDTPHRFANSEKLTLANVGSSRICSSAWARPTGRMAVTVTAKQSPQKLRISPLGDFRTYRTAWRGIDDSR